MHIQKTISFILFGLARMTCNTTYHDQIIMQSNFITSTSVILVYGIAKKVMKKKLYNKLIKVSGVYGIEEPHLTDKRGKWLKKTERIKQQEILKVLLIM